MGPCSSKKQQTNSEQQPYFHELINNIFQSSNNLNRNVQSEELIKPSIKQLIEFLESNQIRIVETIKEIIRRIRESNDINVLNAGLYLLGAIIESLNKFIEGQQKTEPEPEDEDIMSQVEISKQNLMNNEQIVQKMIYIHSELLQAISVYSNEKVSFMQFTFSKYMHVLSLFSKKLLVIHPNKQTLSIVKFLQEIIYKFFLPLIYDRTQIQEMKKKIQFQKRNTIAKTIFKQDTLKEQQIEKIAENMNEAILFDTFEVYIRFVRQVELQLDDISTLFINENQKVLLQALIWLYTVDQLDLEEECGYTGMTLTLLELYYSKAKYVKLLDEYYQTVFLSFNEKLWSQPRKVLFLHRNSGSENFGTFLMNYLESKDFEVDMNESQSINHLEIRQFSYYLENEQKKVYRQPAESARQKEQSSRSLSESNQHELVILKTVVRCLNAFLQNFEDNAFFDWEKSIEVLIRHLIVAQQSEHRELEAEIKQVIGHCIQKVEFLNAVYILIIYVSDRGNTGTVLDLISDNLHLLDDSHPLEDSVVVKLLSLGHTYDDNIKALSIITRIVTHLHVDLNQSCSLIKKTDDALLVTDDSICYFLLRYQQLALNTVFHIYVFIQVLRELIPTKEEIVLSVVAKVWDRQLPCKHVLLLSVELLIAEKYKHPPKYDWIKTPADLNKGLINHLLNFEKHKTFGDYDWFRAYVHNKTLYNLDDIAASLSGKQDFVEQLVDLDQIRIRETQEKAMASQSVSQLQSYKSGRLMTEDSYFENLINNQKYNMLKESNNNSINDY